MKKSAEKFGDFKDTLYLCTIKQDTKGQQATHEAKRAAITDSRSPAATDIQSTLLFNNLKHDKEFMKKIQYSVAMRPNPMHEGDPEKAYATLQTSGLITLSDLAQHISEHNSVFSKGTTVGVLTELSVCIRELLLQGYNIDLGDLGRLSLSISSTGATTMNDFTASNINKVSVKFSIGKALQKLREDAQFEQTTSRAAQAAALKASKAGQTSADWTPQEDGEGGEEEEPEP